MHAVALCASLLVNGPIDGGIKGCQVKLMGITQRISGSGSLRPFFSRSLFFPCEQQRTHLDATFITERKGQHTRQRSRTHVMDKAIFLTSLAMIQYAC